MKTEWLNYLESVGLEGIFLSRVEEVLNFYEQVYPDQIEDIFISEYVDNDRNRHYEGMWLFTENSFMEAEGFLNEHDFDSSPLKGEVSYWNIRKTEYNFRQATAESRMALDFSARTRVRGKLKSSGENCDKLKEIFLKYIIPNELTDRAAR